MDSFLHEIVGPPWRSRDRNAREEMRSVFLSSIILFHYIAV